MAYSASCAAPANVSTRPRGSRSPTPRPHACAPAVFGKAEGADANWHGHVTAVTVAPEFRRLGLARQLMTFLEDVTERRWVSARPRRGCPGCIPGLLQRRRCVLRSHDDVAALGRLACTSRHPGLLSRCGVAAVLRPTLLTLLHQLQRALRRSVRSRVECRRHRHVHCVRLRRVPPRSRLLLRRRGCIWCVQRLLAGLTAQLATALWIRTLTPTDPPHHLPDMRKACARDPDRESMVPLDHPVDASEVT